MALDPASSHESNHEYGTTLNQIGKSSERPQDAELDFEHSRLSRAPAHTAPKPGLPEQTELPFRFIDEFERQNSKNVKKEIRAHVRREIHLKQRKLNEASKSKPLSSGRRRILQKKVDTPSVLPRGSPDLPQYTAFRQHASQSLAATSLQPPVSLDSTLPRSGATEDMPEMDNESHAYASLDFPLSRWQFGNSKLLPGVWQVMSLSDKHNSNPLCIAPQ